jgi:hypothetical protein
MGPLPCVVYTLKSRIRLWRLPQVFVSFESERAPATPRFPLALSGSSRDTVKCSHPFSANTNDK